MSSPSTVHVPADAIPRAAYHTGTKGSPGEERPVVLIAFAKLVLLIGSLVLLAPIWFAMAAEAAAGPGPWIPLRFLVVAASLGIFAFALMALKVWAGLLKHLALAD